MNVEIGAEAAQFPEKEYINGIAVAVYLPLWYTYPLQSEVLPASLARRLQDLEDVRVSRPPLHRVEHHPDLGRLFPSQYFTFLLLL